MSGSIRTEAVNERVNINNQGPIVALKYQARSAAGQGLLPISLPLPEDLSFIP